MTSTRRLHSMRLILSLGVLAVLATTHARAYPPGITLQFDRVNTITAGDLLDRYARTLQAVVEADGGAETVVLHFRPALSGPLTWAEAQLLLELNEVGVAAHCEDPRHVGHTIRAFHLTCFTGRADHQPLPDPLQDTWFSAVIRLADAPADPGELVRRLRTESRSVAQRGGTLWAYYVVDTRTVLLVGDVDELDRVRESLQ